METTEGNYPKEPPGRIMGNISRKFLADLHKNLAHLDIDRSYFPLLLIEAGNGNLIQKELAHKLSCNKVQVVRIIDYLASNGYVERGQKSSDRRKSNLELTEKAKKFLPDIKKAMQQTTRLALKDIPEDKVDELYGLLKKIEKNLSINKTIK
jgi:MarR family transcriptional regulator for hemolysin